MYLASLKVSLGWLGGCPIFYLFLICPYFGPLLHFFGPFWVIFLVLWGYFWGRGQVQNILEPTNVDFQVLFGKYSPIILFLIWPNFGPFCTFWAFRGYFIFACWGYFLVLLGCFWSRGQIQKYHLEHTYEDNQLLF